MSDTEDKIGDTKREGKTLSLRRSGNETGQVRQSFSHGRSKQVLVEKKRSKKPVTGKDDKPAAATGTGTPRPQNEPRGRSDDGGQRRRGGGGGKGGGNRGQMLPTLSEEEHARRVKALEAAKRAQEAAKIKAAEDAKKRAAEEKARQEAEAAEAARLAAEEAERIAALEGAERARAEEEAARKAEEARLQAEEEARLAAARTEAENEARQRAAEAEAAAAEAAARKEERDGAGRVGLSNAEVAAMTTSLPGPKIIKRAPPPPPPSATPPAGREERTAPLPRKTGEEADARRATPRFTKPDAKPARPEDRERQTPNRANRGGEKRRSGKLTITQATSGDEMGRQRSLAAMRRRQERDKRKQKSSGPAAKVLRDVQIPDTITVQELANRMAERGADVIKQLMGMGMMVTINQTLDSDTAQIVVEEMGHRFTRVSESLVEEGLTGDDDDEGDLLPRAPVVTVMGHVDHGKTSLLDALRSANVVSGEAGGITQHIGAYQVETTGGKVTFLDTPGHAAFTSMRARGAQVTDLVILVVAADDSVMPQTVEAITHAQAAEVPMIVAINKMDRPAADADKVRQELLRHNVIVEEMGGDVLTVEVSALKRMGLDKLVETIVLQSEILDLKANPDRAAEGAVVEAQLDVGRGAVATVLVQRGTLRVGDVFVVGEQWGKVRALINDHGDRVDEAGPSEPVEVLGLSGTPEAGDTLVVVESETRAREIADYRQRKGREAQAAKGARGSLDQLLAQAKEAENVSELPILVKSDVQGSAEAIAQALEKIGNDEVKVRLLSTGVGAITESDVTLAEASGAPIIGFNVRANAPAREAANQKGVEIRYYSVIYDLVDDVKAAASGLLSPEIKETFIGYAEILEVFRISNVGNVAGCRITEGVARRSAGVRLLRDNVVVHEGKLKTLKRFKDEVKDVQSGQECGMAFERYEDMRKGDVIEIYETQEVERTL